MLKYPKEVLEEVVKMYPNTLNSAICSKLGLTYYQLRYIASKLGLLKSEKYLKSLILHRNKSMGRDLTDDFIKTEALKYKTRMDLQVSDPSVYKTARDRGILNEVCSHMIPQKYSTPQLLCKELLESIMGTSCDYNNRLEISPYELDIYFPKYKLAFEYDGKGWHKDADKDLFKDELCKQRGITLIRIKEFSRDYEVDIKNQIIPQLDLLNTLTGRSVTPEFVKSLNLSAAYEHILSGDIIKSIVSKYDNYSEFKEKEAKLYSKLSKWGLLDKFTRELKNPTCAQSCIEEIKKYTTLKDFIKNSSKYYTYIKKHKLDYLLDSLEKGSNVKIPLNVLENSVKDYSVLSDYIRKFPGYYKCIKKRKLCYLLDNMDKTRCTDRSQKDELILKTLKLYTKLSDFRKDYPSYYNYIKNHKLYDWLSGLQKHH